MMQGRRDPVVVAWVLGLGLAVLAYAVGPQHFLFRVVDWFHFAAWRLGEIIGDLSLVAQDVVRALAIGLYATFVVLAISVLRRGGRARGALVVVWPGVVTTWSPTGDYFENLVVHSNVKIQGVGPGGFQGQTYVPGTRINGLGFQPDNPQGANWIASPSVPRMVMASRRC